MDEIKGKILIINSSMDVTEAIEPALRSARLASVLASTIGKAVEYIQSNSPALILIDYDVPAKEHVLKACQLIKRIPRCKKTAIHLLLSSDEGALDIVESACANGYILKPLSGPVFLKWLRENPVLLDRLEKVPAPVKPVKPAPVAPVKPVKPAPVAPVKPVKPAPVAPVKPVVQAPVVPVEPVVQAPVVPVEPVVPAPVVPVEPVVQAPVVPVEPVVPAPVVPVEPVVQAPVVPVEPVVQVPVVPVEPVVQAPVVPVEPVVQAPVVPVEPVVQAPVDTNQPVLLIGDCTSLQELRIADTSALGLEFSFGITMGEGAGLLKEITPKVIVIDFDLSDVPGGQACSILKQIPQCAAIPIIMIGDEEERIISGQLENCGASGYLKKPFSTLQFLSYLSSKALVTLPDALIASIPSVGAEPVPPVVNVEPAFKVPEELLYSSEPPFVPSSSGSTFSGTSGSEAFDDLPDMDFDLELPIMDLEPMMGSENSSHSGGVDNFERHLRTGPLDGRIGVCLSLGEQRNTAGVPALIDLLTDGVEDMLTEVVWSLGEIGDSRAIPALVDLLNGSTLLYKSKAIEAIGKIRDDSSVVHVVKMMSEAPYELKIPIIKAFQNIGGENAKKALEFLAADSNYNVAKLAQEVLAEM
jgi:CheY-like chemotaxis protein